MSEVITRRGTAGVTTSRSHARAALQVVATLVAVAAALWVVYRLERVLLLLILTMFFAYLVAPLVRFAERPLRIGATDRRLPRGIAITLVYLIMLAGAGMSAGVLLPKVTQQFTDIQTQAPVYEKSLRAWTSRWARYYDRAKVPVEVRQGIDRSVVGAGEMAIDYARGSLMPLVGALAYVPWLVLIPILAFFFLKDARQFRRAAIKTLPRRFRLRGRRMFDELNTTLATYVRAQVLASVVIGTICGVGFAVLGVPYPALLGVLAGVLEFIPLVGPVVCAAAATVVAALHAPILAAWVVGFLASLRIVQDYAIYPRLVGRRLHLHPLAVVVAVLAGLELNGVAGMFLAVPGVAIVSVVYRHARSWHSGYAISTTQHGSRGLDESRSTRALTGLHHPVTP